MGLRWRVGVQSGRVGDCLEVLSVFGDAVIGLGIYGDAVRRERLI